MASGATRRVLAGVILGVAIATPTLAALIRRGILFRSSEHGGDDPMAAFLEAPCERVHADHAAPRVG